MLSPKEIEDLVLQYKHGDQRALLKIFDALQGAMNLYAYYDPSGARQFEDFKQTALKGIWKACESFTPGKGATAISWILTIVKQKLSKEVRIITKEHNSTTVHLSQVQFGNEIDNEEPENSLYSQTDGCIFEGTKNTDQDFYYAYVVQCEEQLSKINLQLAKIFLVKIIWPNIERSTLSTMLNLSRMSISKHFKVMRKVMDNVLTERSEN